MSQRGDCRGEKLVCVSRTFCTAVVYLRKDHDEGSEADGRNDLDTERRAPLSVICSRKSYVDTVTDPRGRESTDTQHELYSG
jgi:hypothetical protein